jgi:starch synthase
MRIVFATAEFHGIASVGGLALAASGLVHELRRQGVTVDLVMPEYGGVVLEDERVERIDVADWVGPVWVRSGRHAVAGDVHLVWLPGMDRPHPYLDPTGTGWGDNDYRFLAFSRAVAALFQQRGGDVLHLNDWHTAAALAAFPENPPSVLSIHNLAYQGTTTGDWLARLGPRSWAYEWWGDCNPFLGGLRLADAIVAVSPNYAREIQRPESGVGVDGVMRERADHVHGILNGIDTTVWGPATDRFLDEPFGPGDLSGKAAATEALLAELGLDPGPGPLVVMVTRLTELKGLDLVPPLLPYLRRLGVRMAILGAGDAHTAHQLQEAARANPGIVAFVEGYDEALSHRLFAGGDLLLMPSRFEPCGLAQMQAMRYGTLPVGVDVGGLHDTIVDASDDRTRGTGWLAHHATPLDLLDALHRAVAGWRDKGLLGAMRERGMTTDWSWRLPALEHIALYEHVQRR